LATITAGATTASVEYRFGTDGLVESMFVPDRLFDDREEPAVGPSVAGRNLGFVSMNGMSVPADSVVSGCCRGQCRLLAWQARCHRVQYATR
jgi:hypothetical protein